MSSMGKGQAASVAASLRSSFQRVRLALIVGICGGVPNGSKTGIFLGDTIISDEIVAYDFGKRLPGVFRRKETLSSCASSGEVRAFMSKIRSRIGQASLLERTHAHLSDLQDQIGEYISPPRQDDQLFQANYSHKHASKCKKCNRSEHCEKAQTATCEELKCSKNQLVARSRLPGNVLSIHFGRIASGDTVMKSGVDRDKIASRENVIAFEMESAGIAHSLPCLVVKSVCDYADSHKSKRWQTYTAGVSAACMKSLLEQWAVIDCPRENYLLPNLKEVIQEHPPLTRANLEKFSSQVSNKSGSASSIQAIREEATYDNNLHEVLPKIKSSFKCAISSCKKHRKHLPQDSDLKQILRTQRTILFSAMDTLSLKESESDKMAFESLKELCLGITLAIRTKLEGIQSVIKALSTCFESEGSPINLIDRLMDYVEDLQSQIQVLTSSVSQNVDSSQHQDHLKVSRTAESHREFQHFHIVRSVAHSLYDAFQTACNIHDVHDVHLSLRPALNGELDRVGFDMAFIQSTKKRKAIWINVQSALKNHKTCPKVVSELALTGSTSTNLKRPAQEEMDLQRTSQGRGVHF